MNSCKVIFEFSIALILLIETITWAKFTSDEYQNAGKNSENNKDVEPLGVGIQGEEAAAVDVLNEPIDIVARRSRHAQRGHLGSAAGQKDKHLRKNYDFFQI